LQFQAPALLVHLKLTEFFEQVGVLLFNWVIGFSLFYPFFAAMTPVFP